MKTLAIIIFTAIATTSIYYLISEITTPLSISEKIAMFEREREKECYGRHAYHCHKHYDEIISQIENG